MRSFSHLFRNLVNLQLSLLGVVICFAIIVLLMMANYLACEFSFQLLGYDGKPLYADELIGPFLGAFLSKA